MPLYIQLVFTFVGLIVGTTAVLTAAAYTYSRSNLEAEALRTVVRATETRERFLTQLFSLRQQRAEGLLASMQSLCGEPAGPGRLAWAPDCVDTLVSDFRASEGAEGVLLTYRNRPITSAGDETTPPILRGEALARITRLTNGTVEYVMSAVLGNAALTLKFGHEDIAVLFEGGGDLAPTGRIVLADANGQFLTEPTPGASNATPAAAAQELLARCRTATTEVVSVDYRGVRAIQSFRPLVAVEGACIAARIDYEDAVAPAERLRAELVARGAWFVLLGTVLSLVAAHWISTPLRRLVGSARALQSGQFDRRLAGGGPSEVRALSRAFNAMAADLADLVGREQAARREAETANRSKDDFLATVSHELRTPLGAILGWAHMLRNQQLPPERMRHAVDVIERNARAQKQLIEDLLDMSRIVGNRLRLTRENVHVADVVDSALDVVRPAAAAKGVVIETTLRDRAPVFADARRLEQVVWNLAWNAVKFTPPSGRISVQLTRAGAEAVLSVSDTGVGIRPEFLPHIFEWYRQGEEAQGHSGLGLGLSIVHNIVQMHGGTVQAESRGEGLGATFTVRLPIHEGSQAG